MRKLVTSLVSLLAFAASATTSADLKVFACEPEWAALAAELGGGHVSVYAATTAAQDPHRIEARPSLIARLRNADLLVCTGADLEIGWLPLLLRQAANPRVQPGQRGHFLAAGFVDMLEVPARLDRAAGDIHPYGNPHIHTDPRRLARVAAALAQRLATLDAVHADAYATRHAAFATRWAAALERWERQAAALRGTAVVTQHQAWVYLNDWLGLRELATLEPKPGIPPSSAHLAAVQAQLRTTPAAMVVRAAYDDARPSAWLAQRARIPAVELPFTVGGSPRATDLFGLFDDTIDRLLAARR